MLNARPRFSPPSLRTVALVALTAALGATACKNQIIGGSGGGGEGGVAGGGGTGGTITTWAGPSGVAQYDVYYGGAGGYAGGGGTGGYYGGAGGTGGYWEGSGGVGNQGGYAGAPYYGDTLGVRIGNYNPTCDNSQLPGCPNPSAWLLQFTLPYYMQGPGTYPLGHPAVNAYFTESGSDPGEPDTCWGSGSGGPLGGTVEVLSNDGADVVVRIGGTNAQGFEADGQYTVPICPVYYY